MKKLILSTRSHGLRPPIAKMNSSDVWLVGDKYFETAMFESPRTKRNATKQCDFAGGVWYVKKFLEKVGLPKSTSLWTYPEPHDPRPCEIATTHSFAAFPRKPEENSVEVLRIAKSDRPELDKMRFDPLPKGACPKRLLVIEDMKILYRTAGVEEWGPLLRNLKARENHYEPPFIVVLLGGELPDLSPDQADEKEEMWRALLSMHSENTVVIVNADLLRFKGANISRRVSWERTAQDFVTEIQCHARLKRLENFAHVIVRFGVAGAIHCYHESGDIHHRLYYDPKAHDGIFRGVNTEGAVIGNNSVFAACIAKAILTRKKNANLIDTFKDAIVEAIPICQRLFRSGYPPAPTSTDKTWLRNWPAIDVFRDEEGRLESKAILETGEPTCKELIRYAEIPSSVEKWNIIKQTAAGTSMMTLAKYIVFWGDKNSLNLPRGYANRDGLSEKRMRLLRRLFVFHAPLAKFRKLTVIDRDEIESFRGVYNLIKHYRSSGKPRPLSIAVFGPAGSGKTFSLTEIANAVRFLRGKQRISEEPISINMGQIESLEDLTEYLSLRLDKNRKKKATYQLTQKNLDKWQRALQSIPIIFFDEFDCDLKGQKLGWLKTFLGPMQEGILGPTKQGEILLLHRAILIFAGGTKRTFADFAGEDTSISEEEKMHFHTLKGPDFTSRLRGYIDIKGINQTDPSDALYLLRRALMLREYLKGHDLLTTVSVQKGNELGEEQAQIDFSIIHALLRVKTYKYGARSMEALISMCVPLMGRIEKASLPTRNLMEMHVDAEEFHQMLNEYAPDPDDPLPKAGYHLT
jgi:hypothetical protein